MILAAIKVFLKLNLVRVLLKVNQNYKFKAKKVFKTKVNNQIIKCKI